MEITEEVEEPSEEELEQFYKDFYPKVSQEGFHPLDIALMFVCVFSVGLFAYVLPLHYVPLMGAYLKPGLVALFAAWYLFKVQTKEPINRRQYK